MTRKFKICGCVSASLLVLALLPIISISGDPPNLHRIKPSFVFPRAIKQFRDYRGNGGRDPHNILRGEGVGSPAEWTMSKANLVAEFYSSEPAMAPTPSTAQGSIRSHKSFFPFFSGSNNQARNTSRVDSRVPPHRNSNNRGNNFNLVASGTTYVPHAVNFEHGRYAQDQGGFSTPFRPIIKFPQQNYLIPSNVPESGYPNNLRPPRGPPPPPQGSWNSNAEINGLRPPLPGSDSAPSNAPPNDPGKLYLPPPHQPPPPPPKSMYLPPAKQSESRFQPAPPLQPPQSPLSQYLPPQQQSQSAPNVQIPPPQAPPSQYLPPQQQPQSLPPVQTPPPQNPYQPPPPKQRPSSPQNPSKPASSQKFVPSQEYLPPQNSPSPPPNFQPVSSPPQILDTYRKQAVYPVPPQAEKPLVLVMANASSNSIPPSRNSPESFTNYETEPPSPHPKPPQSHSPPPAPSSLPTELALTEPLSQVLAEANAKAGDAMDKTIRFVIHKPEDEDVVKNAILEDAQNRYEDVRFVQGPTLKVQRKETVYLPPKRKTVVYILLKEPQIDTDVQVMTPEEEDPVPEVYITYQKSDGAVKTKHYSPKPIREEDMKKYLDIENDSSYGSGEESQIQPRFSKSTTVTLSTSMKTSRTSASTSSSSAGNQTEEATNQKRKNNPQLASPSSYPFYNGTSTTVRPSSFPEMKPSPLLYSQVNDIILLTGPGTRNYTSLKRPRSPSTSTASPSSSKGRLIPIFPSPRRVLRTPSQCRTEPQSRSMR